MTKLKEVFMTKLKEVFMTKLKEVFMTKLKEIFMTKLKLVLLVLVVSITFFSCESKEPNGPEEKNDIDIIWESIGTFLPLDYNSNVTITFASNGNIWVNSTGYRNYNPSLYLSTNNGDTWTKKYTNSSGYTIWPVAINPVNGYIFCGDSTRLIRSTNNGENWENINIDIIIDGANGHNFFRIFFTPSGEMYLVVDKIYVNETNGQFSVEVSCYYSNNNGNTWIKKSTGLPNSFQLMAVGKDGTLYARAIDGVYHSTDGGNTWLPSSNYNNIVNRLITCDDGSVFATMSPRGVLKSTDKGASWTEVNTDIGGKIIYNPITKDIFVGDAEALYNDYNPITNNYNLYRSDNLGQNWKLETIQNYDCSDFDVNPKNGQIFVIGPEGGYRTKNYPK
jgi:photosystem II stability/assembly factor-like uncharacterized protein